ncbi:hypothetical protein BH11CYA1_BH11CYA1_30180 [soil metagenome]
MSIGMFRQRTIAKDALLAVVFLLVFQLAFALLIILLLHDVEARLEVQRRNLAVVSTSTRIGNLSQKFGILLGYHLSKDRQGSYPDIEKWQSISLRLENEFRRLRALAVGDTVAHEILKEQEKIFRAADAIYREEIAHGRGDIGNEGSTAKLDHSLLVLSSDISDRYQELSRRYKVASKESPGRDWMPLGIVKSILVAAWIINLIFTFTLFAFLFRRIAKRLWQLTDNIGKYKAGKPLNVSSSSSSSSSSSFDEFSQLDKLFREMVQSLENSARYETTLIEGASDVIFTLDAGDRIRDLNAAAISQWGYQPSELEGAPWQTIVPLASRTHLREFLERLPVVAGASSIELVVKTSDGTLIESLLSCYWSEADHSTFCFVSEIGASKRREEQLKEKENDVRMLMRNLPIGLLVVNQSGAFSSTNERMEQLITAYSPVSYSSSSSSSASSVRSLDALFSLSEGASKSLSAESFLTLARQQKQLRATFGSKGANGLACEVTVAELGMASSANNETLIVVEDVSEKVKLESLRKDFLQLLWRNLGEPILKVKQMLLGIDVSTEKEKARVQKFELNANRLLRLLDELLRLEELGLGKLVGVMEPTKVNDLAESAVASLADYALNQGINLEVQSVPLVVQADFERVVQVLINLISNAIKFSFKGGTVLLRVAVVHHQVEFSVIDNGRGVPLAKQAEIFQVYGQANASDARSGTGLGLAICKSIVEAHGGTIGLESRERREGADNSLAGSRFWFKLPLLEVPLE